MYRQLALTLFLLFSSLFAKVYDCFMFFNEFDVLDIRLHELYEHVDYFVLVESCQSHRLGTDKVLYFDLHKERFAPFLDKIIHIKLDKNGIENGWPRENWERNQIMQGLTDCQEDDIIIISDVDEFIPGRCIHTLIQLCDRYKMVGFWQKMTRFFLNRDAREPWTGTAALKYKHLKAISPQEVRNRVRGSKTEMHMVKAGWHFTSMGGYESAMEKYYSIVEGYTHFPSYEAWRQEVEKLPLVPIDRSYPEYVQKNRLLLQEQGLIDLSSKLGERYVK